MTIVNEFLLSLTKKFTKITKTNKVDIMPKIIIDDGNCDGAECGECVDVCPMEILVIDGEKIKIQNVEECNECEVCVDVCPNACIEVKED
jgi:NAD-dependent dihydropyrimidine dehydrogenase PreA subunit